MTAPIDRIDQVYGTDVFSRRVMRQRLPKEIFKSLIRTIDAGEPLDAQAADLHAATIQDWAIENGATHFTRAAQLNPDYVEAWFNLGRTYGQLGRWEDAIPPLQTALSLRPDLKSARTMLEAARAKMARPN